MSRKKKPEETAHSSGYKSQDNRNLQMAKPGSSPSAKVLDKAEEAARAAAAIAAGKSKREAMLREGLVPNESTEIILKRVQQRAIDAMEKEGLTAEALAIELKDAIRLAKTTGKVAKDMQGNDMIVPDLRSLKELLYLWGNWLRLGRPDGPKVQNNTLNVLGEGLNDTERQRVAGLVDLLSKEAERRGLADVHSADSKAPKPKTLRGVVESSEDEPETAD